ncbi:MAG: hypothetical protein MK052_01415 [Alphaproteobacteria bacterium]|nr:hypothetical protein [Alphaproteobacteria bacterium]
MTLVAALLMGYTAACAPQQPEQWSSYYYGSTPQIEQGISYYSGKDVDDNYRLPSDMTFTGEDRSLQVDSLMHGNRMR